MLLTWYFDAFDMTPGKATSVLMYQRTVVMAIMGVSTNIVNVGKVWGSSYKCAKMMVAKKLVAWEGDDKIEGNTRGDFDVKEVKFSYPSKKDV